MRLRAAKLGAKAKKCKFKATQCVHSGHVNQQTFHFLLDGGGGGGGGGGVGRSENLYCVLYSSPVCVIMPASGSFVVIGFVQAD